MRVDNGEGWYSAILKIQHPHIPHTPQPASNTNPHDPSTSLTIPTKTVVSVDAKSTIVRMISEEKSMRGTLEGENGNPPVSKHNSSTANGPVACLSANLYCLMHGRGRIL